MRAIWNWLCRWGVRLLPLVGRMLDAEERLQRIERERDQLLDRLIQITTGAPLGPQPVNAEPPAPIAPKTPLELLHDAEDASARRMIQAYPFKSAADYQHWVETGEWLKTEQNGPDPTN